MTIKDKVVLITGASEGIGKATAELLNGKGAKVAIAAQSKNKLDSIVLDFDDGFSVETDMTDEAAIMNMIQQTKERYGRIDILINNAGVALLGPIMQIKLPDFKSIMELNVYGPLRAMQLVAPIMKEQGGGMIVNVSSNVSKMAIPSIAAYAATKYALNGLSLTARNELKADNIIVTLMHPSATMTGFGKNAIINTDQAFNLPEGMKLDTPEMVAEKILEAITNEPAEQYMTEEARVQFSLPGNAH